MLQRIVLTIVLFLAFTATGCKENILAPQTEFWGEVRFVSQFQKHVWVTTGTGVVMDMTMNPGDVWQKYLTGSQLYRLHWAYPDGTNEGSFEFRPNNVSGDAGYANYKMDWYIELTDGGVSSWQAMMSPAPTDSL